MSTVDKKELMNEVYDADLVTAGVVGVSMASKNVLGKKLTDSSTLKDTAKLAAGVAVSTILVKWAQDKKYIPSRGVVEGGPRGAEPPYENSMEIWGC